MKLALTLRAVVSSDSASGSRRERAGAQNGAAQTPMTAPTSPTSGSNGNGAGTTIPASAPASPSTLPGGGAAGFIQADQATNTLIITCSDAVYRNLRFVIDQLDARRAEVYIESLIVEVTDRWIRIRRAVCGLSGNTNSNYRVGALRPFPPGNVRWLGISNYIGAIDSG